MPNLEKLINDVKKEDVLFEKKHVASFDVDCQNGFTTKCPGELPVPGGCEIASELNAQSVYVSVRVCSKDAHSLSGIYNATPTQPQFTAVEGYPDVDMKWNPHCIIGTFGAKLIDGLPSLKSYNYVAWKGIEPDMHPYGACFHDLTEKLSTGVIEHLKLSGIRTVIVGGLATDFCVKLTALQLKRAKFDVIVNMSACRGLTIEGIKQAVEEFDKEGIYIINKADDLKALNQKDQ